MEKTRIYRSQLITPEGMERLKDELNHLWRVERPDCSD
ncbi:hypothetical protein [Ekhidna sp.]